MTYRDAPIEPLILSMGQGLLALEPATGRVLWSLSLEAAVTRLFRVGERLLVLTATKVTCIDPENGVVIGVVDVEFFPEAGVVCGTDLVLVHGKSIMSGRPSVVCLTADGAIRWKAFCTMESKGLLDGETVFRSVTADGTAVSEARYGIVGESPGIVYQGAVIQPDRR
ncbi:MAG: hypothetical protein KC619_24360 [Myxococcales bacterium]|nr:hypothetical protein [Myxococcales bacterium]